MRRIETDRSGNSTKEKLGSHNSDSYVFFLTDHGTRSDFNGLRELALRKDIDLYIPEKLGWSQNIFKVFNEVSHGRVLPKEALEFSVKKGFTSDNDCYLEALKTQFEVISGISKPVISADKVSNPLKQLALAKLAFDIKPFEVEDTSFAENIDLFKSFLSNNAKFIKLRQDIFISRLNPTKLRESLSDYPEVRRKKQIKSLVCLGGGHIRVALSCEKNGDVEKAFSSDRFLFGFRSQAIQRYIWGYEVSDSLAGKAMLENLMYEITPLEKEIPSQERVKTWREIINSFKFKEIQEVFESNNPVNSFAIKLEAKCSDILGYSLN